jgi:hypothetical protein
MGFCPKEELDPAGRNCAGSVKVLPPPALELLLGRKNEEVPGRGDMA